MKEIRYRAWDKVEKKMYYDVERCYDTLSDYGGNTELSVTSFGDVLETKIPDEQWEPRHEYRFEVMQYTGLHDKNGKEIYEGDIVKYMIGDHPALCTVVAGQYPVYLDDWGVTHYTTGFAFKWHDEEEAYNDMHKAEEVTEVIGNIYENPELRR